MIFSLSSLYVVWSLICFIASVMYSLLSWTTIVEPLSALFIINVGLLVSWLRTCHSCLVRLSDLFCLCLCSFMISSLILCRKVSNVPLSVNLSGL